MEYKYKGIILNKRDIGEADRIYAIYTLEAGKIRVLGKGVRKPNAKLAGNLETITEAEIFVAKNRGMGKITGSIPIDNFLGIKSDLDRSSKALHVFRMISRLLSEEEKDEKIFELLEKYLELMDRGCKSDEEAEILTAGFFFKFLDEMGYRLEMESCVYCGKKLLLENNYFSSSRGGVICPDCQKFEPKKMAASNNSIKLIRIFLGNRLENFTKLKVEKRDFGNLRIILKEALDWVIN